jgi:hypothetical protein
MNGRKLQDRLYRGLGLSARHVGLSADAFRPSGPLQPLAAQNRFLRLPATFTSSRGQYGRTNEFGNALWYGIFDASYTRPGDYLVTGGATYFVASQAPLLPVLCARTNRILSISQPNIQVSVARNPYGGYTSGGSTILMAGWPASIFGEGRSSHSITGLPADQGAPNWNVLLPSPRGIVLSPGDIITDDLGRTAVISGSELTDLGWRITAKMATS